MNQNVFNQKLAERLVLNAVLSSRIYLEDTHKFQTNLSNLTSEHQFQTRNLEETSKAEIFSEYLNQELSTFFNPISLDILLSNSNNPDLKIKNFIMTENPDNKDEHFFISDKYIIKYYEGIYKVTEHKNEEISNFVKKQLENNHQNQHGLPSFYKFPENIIDYIQKLEPRFSFGLFTSVVEDSNIKEKTYHIVFRGTEPDIKKNKFKENEDSVGQYYSNDYLNMNNHYNQIQPFLDLAIRQLPNFKTINKNNNSLSNCNLEITGHSLGGAMVDLFLEKNKNNPLLKNINYQGFAFGNPFGVSARTKIEAFLEKNILNPIKNKLPIEYIKNINDNYHIHQLSNKVKNIGNKFLKISTNVGESLNMQLENLDDNSKLKKSFLFIKNNSYSLTQKSISISSSFFKNTFNSAQFSTRLGMLLGNVFVRGVFNLEKSLLSYNYKHQSIDENFKQIDTDEKSKLISIQHEKDLVTYGILAYKPNGNRFLISDKNTFTDNDKNTVKNAKLFNFGNHKMYNYLYSCVIRLEQFQNSYLIHHIKNVDDAMKKNELNNLSLEKSHNTVKNISKIRNLYQKLNNKLFNSNNHTL